MKVGRKRKPNLCRRKKQKDFHPTSGNPLERAGGVLDQRRKEKGGLKKWPQDGGTHLPSGPQEKFL